MKEQRFFYVPDVQTPTGYLPDEEAQHAIKVLRLKEGDAIVLMDGCGTFHEATLSFCAGKRALYSIQRARTQEPEWLGHVHLAIAPTKMMERTEWLAEKATEVGFDELTLLDCRFSERRVVKMPRIEKIVVAAMKQSRKAWMPRLNAMTDFCQFIDSHTTGHRFIAHCYEEVKRQNLFDLLREVPTDAETIVMVGPEGDFSIDEVRYAQDKGFISVDLGKSRLRTETAGLAAIMMMQLGKRR